MNSCSVGRIFPKILLVTARVGLSHIWKQEVNSTGNGNLGKVRSCCYLATHCYAWDRCIACVPYVWKFSHVSGIPNLAFLWCVPDFWGLAAAVCHLGTTEFCKDTPFYRATAMLNAVYAVVVCLSVCLSVCVCVCVSVTLRYWIKTAKPRIMQIMPHDSPLL